MWINYYINIKYTLSHPLLLPSPATATIADSHTHTSFSHPNPPGPLLPHHMLFIYGRKHIYGTNHNIRHTIVKWSYEKWENWKNKQMSLNRFACHAISFDAMPPHKREGDNHTSLPLPMPIHMNDQLENYWEKPGRAKGLTHFPAAESSQPPNRRAYCEREWGNIS